jgi:branched-chain amino acid transport system permease protein
MSGEDVTTSQLGGNGTPSRFVRFITDNTIKNPLRGVFIALFVFLLYIALSRVLNGEYTPQQIIQQFIFGLSQGSIYALIALGYTLVYGILLMINFAHSEVFMMGAYGGFFAIYPMAESGFLQEHTLLALVIVFFAAMLTSMVTALLLERIAYRPLRNAPRLVPLITAIGASITLQELAKQLFGASERRFPDVNYYVLPENFTTCKTVARQEICTPGLDLIGGIYEVDIFGLLLRIRPLSFITLVIAFLLMFALWRFIQKTKTGKSMRAVAEDKNTAQLMGINVDRVIVITFLLGAALAGAASVLARFIPGNNIISPYMGFLPGVKAFTAAVVGGIGNVPGAMFGGLFLGVVEAVGPGLLGLDNQLQDVIAFGLLVSILIFRPTGIFGEVIADKKV